MSFILNEQQAKAVNHTKGPLLVVAGPGSGKTRVIVEKVLHLVKSGIEQSSILCLTFTEKAAGEMQERVAGEVNQRLQKSKYRFESQNAQRNRYRRPHRLRCHR